MPITSFTGKPGNGKTALMLEHLMQQVSKAERPLFAAGIDGLEPGLATVIKDPRSWNAVRTGETCTCHDTEDSSACDAHVVPNGALIYIDEAWKWFGHLQDAQRQQTPAHVLQLAEHRHRGIDFVWTYQQPSQIFPFARSLMADHHHVVRRFGTQAIDVFKWEELQEDVKSAAKREGALRTTRTLPKDVFGKYKSAEIHTIKAKIPKRVLAIPALVIAAVLLVWFAYTQLKPDAFAAKLTDKAQASGLPEAAPGISAMAASDKSSRIYATATDYAKAHLPRFASMPWTAEVYDGRDVTADPLLYCLSSGQGEDANGDWKDFSCTCLTEQGTTYLISHAECRTRARYGPVYNPYRERNERGEDSGLVQNGGVGANSPYGAGAGRGGLSGSVIPGNVTKVGTGGEAGQPGTSR